MTTPNLCVTSYTYDSSHKMTSLTSSEGYTRTFGWDTGGRVTSL